MTPIQSVSGIGPHLVSVLAKQGISSAEQLAATLPAVLLSIPGISVRRAEKLLAAAHSVIKNNPPATSTGSPVVKAPQKSPVIAELAIVSDTSETSNPPKKAIKKDNKKKAAAKKNAKSKAKAKKAFEKKKAKQKVKAKKAEKKKEVKKAEKKKAVKKKAKASKSKKSGKSKKK